MSWPEYIDRIQQRYPEPAFRVPYADWKGILKKIEERFIIKNISTRDINHRYKQLKNKVELQRIPRNAEALREVLAKLNVHQNYWVLIEMSSYPQVVYYVYDCAVKPLWELIGLTHYSFSIIDKHYNWMANFETTDTDEIMVSSVNSSTPFG
jgi:hypothetical protein